MLSSDSGSDFASFLRWDKGLAIQSIRETMSAAEERADSTACEESETSTVTDTECQTESEAKRSCDTPIVARETEGKVDQVSTDPTN